MPMLKKMKIDIGGPTALKNWREKQCLNQNPLPQNVKEDSIRGEQSVGEDDGDSTTPSP